MKPPVPFAQFQMARVVSFLNSNIIEALILSAAPDLARHSN